MDFPSFTSAGAPPTRRRRTLRGKLTFLVVSSVGIAVGLVAGVSAWRDGQRDAAMQMERLRATATVMASLSAESSAHGDAARGFQVIRSIATMPGVFYARIERPDGRVLVQTGAGARLLRDVSVSASGGRSSLLDQLASRTAEVSSPIRYGTGVVGRVVLVSQVDGVLGRLLASLETSAFAAAAALLVGLLVAWRMQRSITTPVLALTRSMDQVQRDHDFSGAVDVAADDEIGELVAGFNRMLGEIRSRDAAITAHMAGLEGEVAARTADLRVAKEAAENANSAKSDFLATMSHEIRTPMNGIMVMAEMLAVGELPARQRRFAEVIAKSGSSLLAIINDILDFSKIEAGKMDLESVPVDLADVVEDVCSLFWERASSKGLDLAAYIDPATPKLVAGDPVRLRQVIGNLANNAIKFTEQGGVLVEVEPDTPTSVRISVHDTGVGIPKDKIGGVFGAFTQADQSTTRRFGGTGLGLAICKRLVEAMDGRFHVTSEVGRGSTFAFRLPVQALEAAEPWPAPRQFGDKALLAAAGLSSRRALARYLARAGYGLAREGDQPALAVGDAAALQELGPGAFPRVCLAAYGDSAPHQLQRAGLAQAVLIQPFRRRELQGLLEQLQAGEPLRDPTSEAGEGAGEEVLPHFHGARVLVADDSAVNREVAQEALARLGAEVRCVNDGREAVDAVFAERFDLVLMDGSMPELDGYDATREIRAREAGSPRERTPVVALTAHVVGSAADAWRDAGMDGVLHKPFTLQSLAKTLGRYLEGREAPPASATSVAAPPAPPVKAPARKPEPQALYGGEALIDEEVAAQLAAMAAAGRAEFVDRVHGLYRDNAPQSVAKLGEAVAKGDAEAAARAAHALKSMSYNIGARVVARMAGDMELSAREGQLPAARNVEELNKVLAQTLSAIAEQAAREACDPPLDEVLGPKDAELLRDLKAAIAADQLSLAYQPQVDRDGENIIGVEALLRWTHPTRGPVSPALFIPLAEKAGLIGRITTWVADRLLAETRYLNGLQVAFNASAIEFAEPGFVDRLEQLIQHHDYDPRRLEVEITETAILQDEQRVRENIDRLRALGMKVALDDFGAGYSSLGHLRRYPFDKLKIDREFITDCSRDMQSATVVHAVVSIGRALGMKVIAEGVETETQRKFLKVAGVHAMQGYLFGKAVGIDELNRTLSRPPMRAAG
jgi:two-component system, NarL family, sensor histidine kinase BarA